jgi:UDP-N-acetyl-D-glucosamine dehydrogenase
MFPFGMNQTNRDLAALFESRKAVVGVIGLGYVGLPLAVEIARSGYQTVGYDLSPRVVDEVNAGRSHIKDVPSKSLEPLVRDGRLRATTDAAVLGTCDAISICVPTPLNKIKDPDLSYIVAAAKSVRDSLRAGQLIVLESTTYPGTTREVLLPVLEETGLKEGTDFHICFSPERVDPGNPTWQTRNTPKVLGGISPESAEIGLALYSKIFDTMVPVESAEAAELVKVYENTFRMINIALANELAQACEKLGIDVWGVIDAAATKPFGFMKFTPGPGLGGHCIPLDPHYLAWKMRTLSYTTRMIEIASEINTEMPAYVVNQAADVLNEAGLSLSRARVLVLGIAYKRDIDDLRESPALDIIQLLQQKGAAVSYHDPYCPEIADDGHTDLRNLPMRSVRLAPDEVAAADVVLIVTDHSNVDYQLVADHARSIVDTRGIMRRYHGKALVVGLSGTRSPRPAALAT